MTTIAIIGAGRGLGAAVARTFGAESFTTALISRTQQNVDQLAADLTGDGLDARGYAADVRDPTSLTAALDGATQDPRTDRGTRVQPAAAERVPAPGPGNHHGRPGRRHRVLRLRPGHRGRAGATRDAQARPWVDPVRQRRLRRAA